MNRLNSLLFNGSPVVGASVTSYHINTDLITPQQLQMVVVQQPGVGAYASGTLTYSHQQPGVQSNPYGGGTIAVVNSSSSPQGATYAVAEAYSPTPEATVMVAPIGEYSKISQDDQDTRAKQRKT